jgi:glycosyltransferase involved in cell wall biosynthesis
MTAVRVAMLGQYPLDETRLVGGPEAVVVALLRGLRCFQDLEVHILTCQPGVEDGLGETGPGWPLHILKRKRLGRITFHVRDVSSIGRTLRRLEPRVVHAQGMGIYAAAAMHSPYPHVVTTHGIFSREAEFVRGIGARVRGFLDSVFERYCLSRVQNLISISPYVDEEVALLGGFKGHTFRIENPVADAYFAVNTQGEESTILYAGRVLPRKDLLGLLHALTKVRREIPEVRLRVAGETESAPAYADMCRQFIQQQGLDTAVTFLGSLPVEDMVQEYAGCTVLALASKQETAPVVVAEAMAASRPVVATRVCGVPYMVEDGCSGLLVDYGDVDELAGALIRVLCDRQLRLQMGRHGREMAEARYRLDVVAGKTRQVYMQLSNE